MSSNRRQFIQASALGAAAATIGLPLGANAGSTAAQGKSLEILILGGTGFIGPHMVREALRRGHNVTLFNRGRTANDMFPDLETIKGDRNNGLDGLNGRRWDAVIDNSGYVPRHVADSARLLSKNVDHYVYISSVSVYADFKTNNTESSPLATLADESTETVNGETYGALKALCEKRAREELGDDKLTVVRPTYIAGPGDHTDRFSYWPIRTQRGGEMIWPGRPTDTLQVVDVRDLGIFSIDCVERRVAGIFNATNPGNHYSMNELLLDSQQVSGSTVEPIWVDEAFLYDNQLIGGRMLPVWHPKTGEFGVDVTFDDAAARKAGLPYRPEKETIRDILAWWGTLDESRRSNMKAGIPADREAELIAAWKAQS